MASTSSAAEASTTQSLPIRTITLDPPPYAAPGARAPTVCLARFGLSLVLSYSQADPEDEYQPSIYTSLSVMVGQDPFPGYSIEGNECFWMKTYSENVGLLEQLVRAGWLRDSGRTIKQGFVTMPMVEIRLDESEIAKQCPNCERFELVTNTERFKRCSRCKRTYYCSAKCQNEDYHIHKTLCKDLAAQNFAEVENRRRKEYDNWKKSPTEEDATMEGQ